MSQLVNKIEKMAVGGSSAGGSSSSTTANILLKTPKGTKDWLPEEMRLRESIFKTIVTVFKKHGGQTIDTPVFELLPILQGKYGEDSKLIFELKDQGGELTALRYDLTVPFARFLAQHPEYTSLKRYHIAKVYRRDQPAMSKGRMREFYQCDFDIAGSYDPMIPDAECLKILVEILDGLKIDNYLIKVNHRKILDGIFEICGVPLDKIRTISSAVDKLDKLSWDDVRREMTEEKGLDGQVADEIGKYVNMKGGHELLEKLYSDPRLAANTSAKKGLEEMALLFKYVDLFGITRHLSLDMSLARGLDYYTGLVYEAVTEGSAPKDKTAKKGDMSQEDYEESVGIGSISGGGRYDELVGMFSSSKKAGASAAGIPCVGISIGVERLFSILRQKQAAESMRRNETAVYVIALGGNGLLDERLKIANECWQAGIATEFAYKLKPRLPAQFATTQKEKIPLAVIIGQQEVNQGMVKIKELGRQEDGYDGEQVQRSGMVDYINRWLESAQRSV